MLTYVQSSRYTLRKGEYTGVSNTNTTSSRQHYLVQFLLCYLEVFEYFVSLGGKLMFKIEMTECEPRMQDTNITCNLFTCESGAEPEQSDPEEDDGEAGSAFTWNTKNKEINYQTTYTILVLMADYRTYTSPLAGAV